ncbi:hypothetical protein BDV93DRAFT_603464 [Ceratobasidium sp. AG-I]|nr:hypothetical protein BDV93DRAFT_603464 [Ceratobasidium sp. AG-I]
MSTDEAPISEPATANATPAEASGATAPLSKSAQKRLARSERFAQVKLERRAREKEEKAAKRKEREEREAAGEDVGPPEAKKRRVTREGEGPVKPFGARIVVDLGFDEKMTEKEVGSLCSQLSYTYASHRRTRTPFTSLLFTSLGGRAMEHLDGINDGSYRRWKGAEWWTEDFDGLWKTPPAAAAIAPELTEGEPKTEELPKDEPASADIDAGPSVVQEPTEPVASLDTPQTEIETSEQATADAPTSAPSSRLKSRRGQRRAAPQARASCSQESVVYLTADAEDELLELKEGETYIIGGIVDRNRYKNLCANKARDLNVRSARLPIGRYLADMPTRKVLTVNQVFDILVHWVTTRDWEQAMQKVMPKRKFNANGKKGKHSKDTSIADDDENQDDEEEVLALMEGGKANELVDDETHAAVDAHV